MAWRGSSGDRIRRWPKVGAIRSPHLFLTFKAIESDAKERLVLACSTMAWCTATISIYRRCGAFQPDISSLPKYFSKIRETVPVEQGQPSHTSPPLFNNSSACVCWALIEAKVWINTVGGIRMKKRLWSRQSMTDPLYQSLGSWPLLEKGLWSGKGIHFWKSLRACARRIALIAAWKMCK